MGKSIFKLFVIDVLRVRFLCFIRYAPYENRTRVICLGSRYSATRPTALDVF